MMATVFCEKFLDHFDVVKEVVQDWRDNKLHCLDTSLLRKGLLECMEHFMLLMQNRRHLPRKLVEEVRLEMRKCIDFLGVVKDL
jgi:hypothetical protein